jgi:molecular chaperone DnaK (HSP70)
VSRQVVGIDLGTSNTAIARFEPRGNALEIVPIVQRVSSTEVGERPLLPSFLYLPGEYELPAESTSLPWDPERNYLVGEFARYQGSRVPGRCVVSAKSWLAHRSVDPCEPMLPWDRASDLRPVSAVAAITRYLEHIVEAWNYRFPNDSLQGSEVVLTIPASFDDLARKLTAGAAASVGLPVRLLEEPQAAFYSWLWRQRKGWKKLLSPGDVILVCDIGGGTSDFTLIRYDGIDLERVAVGDHLMLGGDNLDIALAYLIEPRLPEKLNGLQWGVLRQQCRASKELLLGEEAPRSATVTVPGSGSRLLGGALSTEVTRDEVLKLVLDGFFPRLDYEDILLKGSGRALKELGLPFESDPAVPRHLSRFLHAHSDHFPNRILFNGGACAPAVVRSRVSEVVSAWRAQVGLDGPALELENQEAHLAVARGAAWYGHQRQSDGLLVEGGTARSYYLGLADRRAVCVIPASAREGQQVVLAEPKLALRVGEPAAFPLFSSSMRPRDEAGALVPVADLVPLPVLQTQAEMEGVAALSEVKVQLAAEVTPVGTLDIRCLQAGWSAGGEIRTGGQAPHAPKPRGEFRLEFSVRDGAAGSASADLARPEVQQARLLVTRTFNHKPKDLKGAPVRPKNLLLALEGVLGKGRDEWPPVVLRTLWDSYWAVESRRRVEPEYEAAWLNGIGFCLRPGVGMPLDDWRVMQLEKLLEAWMQFSREDAVKSQFFILFRRVATGLRSVVQRHLWDQVHPVFLPGRKHIKTRNKGTVGKEEAKEMLRMAVSLERLPVEEKVALANVLLASYKGARDDLWLLTRLLARQPLDPEAVPFVIPAALAGPMLERIGAFAPQDETFGRFALVNMARRCGDPLRDLDPELFEGVEESLMRDKAPRHLLDLLRGQASRTHEESAALFGDSLPVGLRLAEEPVEVTAV